jgi:hypothetical protein
MSNYGISIGSNIDTNTDKTINFTSKYSSLKLYKWGDVSFTTNGSAQGSVEIPHDLGYTPIVEVYRKTTAQYTFLSATSYSNAYMDARIPNSYAGSDMNEVAIVRADNSKILIRDQPIVVGITGGTQPNTTYYFRYMIFVDKSEVFTNKSNIALTGDYGFKVAKDGIDVINGQEYDMAYSSKYKAVQFYDQLIMSSSLTLPAMWSSVLDQEVEEATYVDFNHNLGYAPYFIFFIKIGSVWLQAPYFGGSQVGPSLTGLTEISAWCDSTRVRILAKRLSYWYSAFLNDNEKGGEFAATTYEIKVVIFTVNLTESYG